MVLTAALISAYPIKKKLEDDTQKPYKINLFTEKDMFLFPLHGTKHESIIYKNISAAIFLLLILLPGIYLWFGFLYKQSDFDITNF